MSTKKNAEKINIEPFYAVFSRRDGNEFSVINNSTIRQTESEGMEILFAYVMNGDCDTVYTLMLISTEITQIGYTQEGWRDC
jgi:hypothetical protein